MTGDCRGALVSSTICCSNENASAAGPSASAEIWLGIILAALSGSLEVVLPLLILWGESRRRMWIVLVRGFSARMSHETVNWIRTKAFPTFFFVSTTLLCTTIRLFANKLAPSVLTVPVEFSTRIIGAFMMSRFDHFPSETGALWRQGLAIAMLLEGVLFISVVGRRFKSICPCIARSYCQVLRQSFLLPSCLLASAAALITAAICSRRWHRKELQLRTVLFWLVVIILGALESVSFRVLVTAIFFFSPSGPAPNAFVAGTTIVWVGLKVWQNYLASDQIVYRPVISRGLTVLGSVSLFFTILFFSFFEHGVTGMFTSISVVPFLLGIVMIMCGSFFYDVRRAFAKADDSWGNQVARILPADGKTFIIKEGVTVREVDDRKIPTHNLSSSCVTSTLAAAAAAATQGTCTATSPPRHIYGVGMDPTGLRAMAAFALDIGTAGSVLGVKDRHTAASKAASKWLGRQKNGSDANSKLGGVCKQQDRSGSTKALAEDDRARGSNTIDWPPLFVFVILTALGPASVVVESNWG